MNDPPTRQTDTPLILQRNLLIVFSITLVGVMGTSSISPALPSVVRAFGVTMEQSGWLIAGFAAPGIILSPLTGMLADRFGRKPVLVPSLLLFAAAGHACAYADGFETLLALRILQGVGAASLGALNATLIGDLYDGNERAAAMGYNGGLISFAAAAYPLVGGALALAGWRYPFVLPLLAVPSALAIAFWLKNPEPYRRGGFVAYLQNVASGVRQRQVVAVYFVGFAGFTMLYGAKLTFLPFLLEQRFAASSAVIGLVFGASAIASAGGSMFLGRLARRIRPKIILLVGVAAMAAGLASIPSGSAVWMVTLSAALFGAGHGLAISMSQVVLANATTAETRGAVMALNGMMFRLAQTLGPLAMAVVLAAGGLNWVYWGGATFGMIALAILATAMRR
ncbi:MAG: MFS transporter [Alphaproteobacteria bacterium]